MNPTSWPDVAPEFVALCREVLHDTGECPGCTAEVAPEYCMVADEHDDDCLFMAAYHRVLDAFRVMGAGRERLIWYEDRAAFIMETVKAGDGNDQLWHLVSDLCDDWAKRRAPDPMPEEEWLEYLEGQADALSY